MSRRVLKIEAWDDDPPILEGMGGYRGSQIRLKGQWLKAAGFHAGATVSVESEHAGIIILKVNSAVGMTAADPEFQRVGAALDAACALADRRQQVKGGV